MDMETLNVALKCPGLGFQKFRPVEVILEKGVEQTGRYTTQLTFKTTANLYDKKM